MRRVSNSARSPILAFPEEVEDWVRKKNTRASALDSTEANCIAFRQTRIETRRLVDELRAERMKHRSLLMRIKNQIGKFPTS